MTDKKPVEVVDELLGMLEKMVKSKASTEEVKAHRTEVVGTISNYREDIHPRVTAKYLTKMGNIIRDGGYILDE